MILYLRHASGSGGGADRVIANTACRIDKTRFPLRVALICPRGSDVSPILSEMRAAGVTAGAFPGYRWFDREQFAALRRMIVEDKIRVLHCHDSKSDVLGRVLRGFHPHLRLVSTAHGWIARSRRERLYVELDLLALRGYDVIIAVSETNARYARRRGVTQLEIIPNGIDADVWRTTAPLPGLERPDRPFRVGFVGRLSEEKGALDFVRMAHRVRECQAEVRFVIAGEGPQEGAMRSLVAQLGVAGQVDFLGRLDPNRLRALYESMDALTLTSLTEGLPMSILEACAMRRCVIAPCVGGIPELIEHERNGLLTPVGDYRAVAAHVMTLATARERAALLGNAARRTVEERFSIRGVVTRMEALYAQLLC